MRLKEVHEIRDYSEWNDGHDFRPSQPYFCEKCNHKGTFLRRIVDTSNNTASTIAQDCECKIEHITKLKLKSAGIRPEYRLIDPQQEFNEKTRSFFDKYYDAYQDPNKLVSNFLITGNNLPKKTKFLSVMAKYMLLKSVNVRLKYITMHDLLINITKTWTSGDDSEIQKYNNYDFFIIDKVELGLNYVRQNMNIATFNSIIDHRVLQEKPTIISCASEKDLDFLNLDADTFIIKEIE